MRCEALIIGAGLSGAVMARRLAEAGMDVICLEQGARHGSKAYPGRNADWELASMGQWHPNPNIRKAPGDYPIDDSRSDIKPMMFNGVGGSTILYGAQWMRFLPSDFRTRTLDGVGDDWPITYAELAPFYDRVDRAFGVSGANGDPAQARHADYPMPALPLSTVAERVAAAHNRLNWHWWPGSNAIASQSYGAMRPCVQRGVCGTGCPEDAKASVDITHWPVSESHGARLLTGARVSRITHDAAGHASGAVFTDRAGVEHAIAADITIVAANAVGTPRLLLASISALFPQGLANGSGLVGKRLMFHPFGRAIGLFDEPMETWQGHWGQQIYSLEFAETRPELDFTRGAKWNFGPSGGPLAAALFPWPGEAKWGEALHDHVAASLGRSAVWGVICEDLPEEANHVDLHPDRVDADGNPVPRLHYRISENSARMLRYNLKRAEESLWEAGAQRVMSVALPDFGWHPLGTCRMGSDPAQSVVDSFGRTHDVPGLYVIDGSILVTGSCANPAATIAALALRSADHIVATRSH
ncbi:GMC family oxidoreductase [Acidisoma cladoniae]|jgi:choline dehydrogenase-like flavoprotein|uniref:GMC family oxidoreductase n=1 Tax=Acidisoma cladoniae TaxID=3040935 RepID=UPI00255142D7|nr:GMC family oxidoreductase [Acidisoma sp. PAMC 29798]